MPSPFAGVDPFIEAQHFWQGFHTSFISICQETILESLPEAYDAQIEERIYLAELSEDERQLLVTDMSVIRERTGFPAASGGEAVATLEPVTVPLEITYETRERFIQITRQEDGELIAIFELLSPSNKRNPDRGVYVQRRNGILNQPVHLVELDLLLDGERLPMRRPLPPAHFYALVSRAERRPNSDVYGWTIRDGLPTIPIPLKAPDADLALDLAKVFRETYNRGQYQRRVKYRRETELSLGDADQAWLDKHLGERGA